MTRTRTSSTLALAVVAALLVGTTSPARADEGPAPTTTAFEIIGSAAIAGVPAVGAVLTATSDGWSPAPAAFTYAWSVAGHLVSSDATYTPTAADLGQAVAVAVTAHLDGYDDSTVTAVAATPVVEGQISFAGSPLITGVPRVGSTLTASVLVSPLSAPTSFTWFANGKAIPGATSSLLTLTKSQLGTRITVRASATLEGYRGATMTSARTAVVTPGRFSAPPPVISGNARVGETVCVEVGAWEPAVAVKYQWYLNGSKIAGATRACLKIAKAAWRGKKLTVAVTGAKAGYITLSKRSAATAAIVLPHRTDPTSLWNCPSWAPIKGNASSMIYHMPGQRFYSRTQPEDCFSSESAARNAGYRKAKV